MKHKTLSPAQLDALIDRIKQAQEHQLALSPEDLQLILNSLLSLITMQHELASQSITVKKLRKLAGIVNADERLRVVFKNLCQFFKITFFKGLTHEQYIRL